jgi:hypothetical protein
LSVCLGRDGIDWDGIEAGRDPTFPASKWLGQYLAGGGRIPAGDEKWIPGGDGDPFAQ